MREWNLESRVLRQALDRNLITQEEVDEVEREAARPEGATARMGRWGPRIEILFRRGRLDAATIEALAGEAAVQTGATGPQPGSTAPPPERRDPGFPVSGWDRYEFVEFLGEGGMGRVFKARDARLKRFVALKFLWRDDPELIRRFSQEAQSQARIEHEHICKVFEVGEVEGHPFIAMQFIPGETLADASERMTPEQKVKVIEEIAQAVHAAHREGVIHRDLKPGNIMIERAEDGRWKPYVMDFGLAREVAAPGLTQTGVLMGTPEYMAPEQARGDSSQIDRRTDVYSLGATLYALLSGTPPFPSASIADALIRVLQEEPVGLKKRNPSLPADLDTIVMKCLRKLPQERYDSARALAEDLRRFLDGEPIAARPPSLRYRLAKRIEKHRPLAAVIVASSLAVLVLGAIAARSEWRARERAAVAQSLGQKIKEIESIMRVAVLLPLHDTRREKALVRRRMQEIAREMEKVGSPAQGPGHYSLGRGHLALRDFDRAREELQAAWKAGYRGPEVRLALGAALGELFRRGREEASNLANPALRQESIRQAERRYRDPALAYLRASHDAPGLAADYVEGLIAFYEGRYPDALERARRAFERSPSLYEARQLEGNVDVTRATEAQIRGDYTAASRDYEEAGRAFRTALEIGRSDATVHEGECNRCVSLLQMAIVRGEPAGDDFEQAISSCDRAIAADPESSTAYDRKSTAYWRWSELEIDRGQDPTAALRSAVAAARTAIARDPRDAAAHRNLSLAYEGLAGYETSRGRDASESLKNAVRSALDGLALNPADGLLHNSLGNSYVRIGVAERARGSDPRESLRRAIVAYQKGAASALEKTTPYDNIGLTYLTIGQYEMDSGIDPRQSLARAVEFLDKSIHLNPNRYVAYNNLGLAWRIRALEEIETGQDPRPSLARAIESLAKAIERNPGNFYAHANTGISWKLRAADALGRGEDPSAALDRARRSIGDAIRLNSSLPIVFVGSENACLEQASIELLAARWAMRVGGSPEPFFRKAQEFLERIDRFNPRPEVDRDMAQLFRWRAQWRLSQGLDPRAEIARGLALARKALDRNPKMSDARAIEGALSLVQAKASEPPEARAAAGKATALLQQALQENFLLRNAYGNDLEDARRLGR